MINIDSEGFLQEHVDNVPRQGWNRLREVDRFFWGGDNLRTWPVYRTYHGSVQPYLVLIVEIQR